MAGGKLTPRQKMINLMYLVFIAMLALNMSKEVLSAFGILNAKLTDANQVADVRNTSLLGQLGEKAAEQPKTYASLKAKADQIRTMSADLNSYIEKIKVDLLKDYKKDESGHYPYEAMDKTDAIDEMWFAGDKLSPKGEEFVNKINKYAADVNAVLGNDLPELQKEVSERFSTKPVKANDGATKMWLDYHYKGFPLIASVTKLTQLQADIKTTESDIMSAMFQGSLKLAASLSAFEAIVVPDKTAFFAGETVTGKIILGKKDPNLRAHSVVVNGKTLDQEAMQSGQTLFSFSAGNVGEQDITGQFQFKEGDSIIKLDIKGNYVVVPKPNSATISADKMNSVYRGVSNPMTISFAGISDNNVTVQAPGLTKGTKPGQYNWRVDGISGTTAVINVTGKLPDGTTVSDKKTFNVRQIPKPVASLRGLQGSGKGNKNDLAASTISVVFPDFVFDVTATVKSFEIKVPGSPMITVPGNKFNDAALRAIAKAQRGDQVAIMNVQTDLVGAPGYKMPGSTPFVWEVQ